MKSVECVAFSCDSRLLCSGSWDKSAILWNTEVVAVCSLASWFFYPIHYKFHIFC